MIKIMKPTFFLVVCALGAFAQTKPAAAAPAIKIDKPQVEAYLRHLELWIPQVTVTIDDPTPAPDMPGYGNMIVHLAYNGAATDIHYFVSQDGKHMFKGDAYDLSKSPFQSNLDKLKTDGLPVFGGPAGAPVTLEVFGDFQCPFCKEEATVLRSQIPTAFPGKVRVYFNDFPLTSIHPWSKPAAITGKCVFKQRQDAFWKFHDWIYDKQQEITLENLNSKVQEWAGANGVDAVALGRCVDTKATEGDVDKSIALGRALDVQGTPTLFLNGRKLMDNMAQWQVLQQLISMELDHQAKAAEAAEKCCTVTPPTLGGK
jgi:protein-disulfide isomerase